MRVAVVGTGFGARVVAPAFAATPGCEVVEVVSARDDRAVREAVGRRDVDLVSVHSPPFLHRAHVDAAVAAGHAVLCDKPFGLGAHDAASMLAVATDAGVVHLCNLELRFLASRRALRDIVASGALGRVERISWVHLSAGSRRPLRRHGWLFDAASGGGWVGAWAPHAIDALWYLLGADGEVTDVSGRRTLAVAERLGADGRPRRVDAEDGLSATLRLSGGAVATFDSTFAATSTVASRITIVGSDAIVECIGDRRVRLLRAGSEPEAVVVDGAAESADHHVDAMRAFARAARGRVDDGVATDDDIPTFADAVPCARAVDRLRALPLVPYG